MDDCPSSEHRAHLPKRFNMYMLRCGGSNNVTYLEQNGSGTDFKRMCHSNVSHKRRRCRSKTSSSRVSIDRTTQTCLCPRAGSGNNTVSRARGLPVFVHACRSGEFRILLICPFTERMSFGIRSANFNLLSGHASNSFFGRHQAAHKQDSLHECASTSSERFQHAFSSG